MQMKKTQDGNTMTIHMEGWLDVETAPKVQREVEALPEEITKLILDCNAMEYISSAGLRTLVVAHKLMSKKDGMILTGLNDDVRNVLDMSGFLQKLHVE